MSYPVQLLTELYIRLGRDDLASRVVHKSSNEAGGPCPKCGGRDRFFFTVHNRWATCRQCGFSVRLRGEGDWEEIQTGEIRTRTWDDERNKPWPVKRYIELMKEHRPKKGSVVSLWGTARGRMRDDPRAPKLLEIAQEKWGLAKKDFDTFRLGLTTTWVGDPSGKTKGAPCHGLFIPHLLNWDMPETLYFASIRLLPQLHEGGSTDTEPYNSIRAQAGKYRPVRSVGRNPGLLWVPWGAYPPQVFWVIEGQMKAIAFAKAIQASEKPHAVFAMPGVMGRVEPWAAAILLRAPHIVIWFDEQGEHIERAIKRFVAILKFNKDAKIPVRTTAPKRKKIAIHVVTPHPMGKPDDLFLMGATIQDVVDYANKNKYTFHILL